MPQAHGKDTSYKERQGCSPWSKSVFLGESVMFSCIQSGLCQHSWSTNPITSGTVLKLKTSALVSAHIHLLALPNSLLSISTIYCLGHLLSQATRNAADYIHSHLTFQDHDKREASSVFFLIRFFAVHTSPFSVIEKLKRGIFIFWRKIHKDLVNHVNPSSQGLKKNYHFLERWEINNRSETCSLEDKKKQGDKQTQHRIP